MIQGGETRINNAIAAFQHTEVVLTEEEFDELVANGGLVEGCDYKIIEDEEEL